MDTPRTAEAIRPGGESAQQAEHASRQLSESAAKAAGAVSQQARSASQQMKQEAKETQHRFQETGKAAARERKGEVGAKIKECGAAVRRAAGKLREEQDPNIAHYADLVAGRLERAGEYVQAHDFPDLIHDAENFARRRPELVFGAMFVAGLAASRFLKASSQQTGPGKSVRGNRADWAPSTSLSPASQPQPAAAEKSPGTENL